MKHILVTGGAGFIGSQLAEIVIARGDQVTVLDDESTGSRNNLHALEGRFDFHYVIGDVSDRQTLARVLTGIDEVYHLAAAVGVKLIAESPIESIERNIRPLEVLLELLAESMEQGRPVKLFLASSSEVYGKNPLPRWKEDDDLVFGPTTRSRWSYGASKAIDEFLALAYWRQYRLPVVIGRFFNVVGPRQTGRYGMVLPRFVDAALAGRSPVVHDDGQQTRCFAHVEDVCRTVLMLMDCDAAQGQVFNIGSDRPVTILELAQKVIAAVDPQLEVEFETYADAYDDDFEDVRNRVPDLSKLRRMIRYQLEHDLDSIIEEVVRSRRV